MRREILELVRRDGDALAALKVTLDRLEDRTDSLLTRVDALECRVGHPSHETDPFHQDLRHAIRKAVSDAIKPLIREL